MQKGRNFSGINLAWNIGLSLKFSLWKKLVKEVKTRVLQDVTQQLHTKFLINCSFATELLILNDLVCKILCILNL